LGLLDLFFGSKPKRRRVKKTVARNKNWRSLEKRGRRTAYFKGYKIETQKYSKSTKTRPDFVGYSKKNPRDRIVGDAKLGELVKNMDKINPSVTAAPKSKQGVFEI